MTYEELLIIALSRQSGRDPEEIANLVSTIEVDESLRGLGIGIVPPHLRPTLMPEMTNLLHVCRRSDAETAMAWYSKLSTKNHIITILDAFVVSICVLTGSSLDDGGKFLDMIIDLDAIHDMGAMDWKIPISNYTMLHLVNVILLTCELVVLNKDGTKMSIAKMIQSGDFENGIRGMFWVWNSESAHTEIFKQYFEFEEGD